MRIGIMSAMREENALLEQQVVDTQKHVHAKREFTSGMLCGHEVVLTFSRWGKVAAAITATHLISHFKVDAILFTGVAGSCSRQVRIGDIVIGTSLLQHDLDARPLYPQYEIPLTGIQRIKTCDRLHALSQKAAHEFLKSGIHKERMASFNIVSPSLHCGLIASGDKFFASKKEIAELSGNLPEVLCVEMEGAAVAQVCHECDIPCTIIRTISDDSSENSPKNFLDFVTTIASHYSLDIVVNILKNYPQK